MIELKRRELQFKLDDEIYNLRFPTLADLEVFSDKQKDEKVSEVEVVLSMLEFCGLKREVAKTLEPHHAELLVQELIGDKKK